MRWVPIWLVFAACPLMANCRLYQMGTMSCVIRPNSTCFNCWVFPVQSFNCRRRTLFPCQYTIHFEVIMNYSKILRQKDPKGKCSAQAIRHYRHPEKTFSDVFKVYLTVAWLISLWKAQRTSSGTFGRSGSLSSTASAAAARKKWSIGRCSASPCEASGVADLGFVGAIEKNTINSLQMLNDQFNDVESLLAMYFPTCQVRVVRFYQSSCPPPPPPPRLAVLFLVVLLLTSSSSFSSTMSASTSTSTSALPTRRQALRQFPSSVRTAGPQPGSSPAQCAPLDLNLGRSQLSAHRWTSTWDLSSSVRTAGPQPVIFPAQCAPLDLNLGPSQLSAHRWTSTWDLSSSVRTAGPQPGTFPFQLSAHRWTSTCDLPSSVRTAGPQPGTFPAQCAPLDLNLGPPQLSAHRWTSTAR